MFLGGDLLRAWGSGVEMSGWRWRLLFGTGLSLVAGDEGASISGLEPHLYFWQSGRTSELRGEHHFTSSITLSLGR